MNNQPVRLSLYIIAGIAAILVILDILEGGQLNIALPLVFLVLGESCFLLIFFTANKTAWIAVFYLPGALLLTLGLIFLVDILTQDWNSWAYAWILLPASIGAGMLLANYRWRRGFWIQGIGWGLTLLSLIGFAVFGAIVGGWLIKIIIPTILIVGAFAALWSHPGSFLQKYINRWRQPADPGISSAPIPDPKVLVEPLTTREMEVLRLIEKGLSNQQIAVELSVSLSTVKTHTNNLYGKLNVRSRSQALRRAHELGLLLP
jgi:DNA-binding CsgD family transcriptional regulator